MNDAPAFREPFVIYAVASLAVAVVLLTAAWAALFRRPAAWLPIAAAVVLGLAYTLFPDLSRLSIGWDALFLLVLHVLVVYSVATFLGCIVGDALERGIREAHRAALEDAPNETPVVSATGDDEATEDERRRRRPRASWLHAFRGSWYRPGPV